MNDTVRAIPAVARIDHAETVASGLEDLAREIREGRFPFAVEKCAVVVTARRPRADDVAVALHGAESSAAEVIGLLELAKMQVASDDG